MGIRLEQLSTGSLFFYVIDNKVSRMIKPIFALCVFIAAIQAYPFRQNQSCKMSCAPCDELVKVPGNCFCQSRPCSLDIPKCKDGQSPEPDTCNCRTCWKWSGRGGEQITMKTAAQSVFGYRRQRISGISGIRIRNQDQELGSGIRTSGYLIALFILNLTFFNYLP